MIQLLPGLVTGISLPITGKYAEICVLILIYKVCVCVSQLDVTVSHKNVSHTVDCD